MSKSYSISSQNSGQATNILMANVRSFSGEGKLSIKSVEQFFLFTLDNIPANLEIFINKKLVDFDYVIRSVFWTNANNSVQNSNVLFTVYEEGTIIKKLNVSAGDLSAGTGFGGGVYPLLGDFDVSVQSDFLIDGLTFVVEPCLILNRINVR